MGPTAERRLTIALDATPLLGQRTGIGEFCASLLGQLATRPALDMGAFAITRAGRGALTPLLPSGARLLGRPGPGVPARLLHLLWAKTGWPTAEMMVGKCDVVHGTNFVVPPARAATVVTVHDLSPLHYPQWAPAAARAYPGLVRAAVRRGAWVHADSAFVAGEVVDLLGVPAERVRAVHLGVTPLPAAAPSTTDSLGPGPAGPAGPANSDAANSDAANSDAANSDAANGGPTNHDAAVLATVLPSWADGYVLAMSRVGPRKDLPTLVKAFDGVATRHPHLALVVAGPSGPGAEELDEAIARCSARRQVVRAGWVSDAQRNALFRNATVFAYPSLYEGFGLPPLQAMSVGTPVVATNCGALKEVLGDGALLVGVGDHDALAEAIQDLVDDPQKRQLLSAKGRQRAAGFTWAACADGITQLYHDAASRER